VHAHVTRDRPYVNDALPESVVDYRSPAQRSMAYVSAMILYMYSDGSRVPLVSIVLCAVVERPADLRERLALNSFRIALFLVSKKHPT
jgi:hypothetical protein